MSARQSLDQRSCNPLRIDAVVLVEPLILDGDNGMLQILRDVLDADQIPVGLRERQLLFPFSVCVIDVGCRLRWYKLRRTDLRRIPENGPHLEECKNAGPDDQHQNHDQDKLEDIPDQGERSAPRPPAASAALSVSPGPAAAFLGNGLILHQALADIPYGCFLILRPSPAAASLRLLWCLLGHKVIRKQVVTRHDPVIKISREGFLSAFLFSIPCSHQAAPIKLITPAGRFDVVFPFIV